MVIGPDVLASDLENHFLRAGQFSVIEVVRGLAPVRVALGPIAGVGLLLCLSIGPVIPGPFRPLDVGLPVPGIDLVFFCPCGIDVVRVLSDPVRTATG